MAEESKIAGASEGQGSNDPSKSAGKQPAADSGDDGSDYEDDAPSNAPAGSASAPSAKKKSKRKKAKEILSGKSADPEADMKKAIATLPPDQLAEFMKLNPALAQELTTEGPSSDGKATLNIEALKQLRLQDIMTGLASSGKNVKDMASYKFWQTQPVPKFSDEVSKAPIEEGPIRVQKLEDVPQEPQNMMDGFEWDTVDLSKPDQLKEVYELLNGHYVEDTEAMFRFKYSTSILKWAMLPPGWVPEWYAGVRASQSKKLVAFISAIPVELRIRNKTIHASEVNFMVIHKKLRSKRLAPVLIKEITRRCNLKEVWQAIYTGGTVLPKPVSTCRYFHRAINWQKLWEVGFSPLPHGSKPQYQVRKYALPETTSIKGLREMKTGDIDAVLPLFKKYLERYDLAQEFTREEFEHWMVDKKDPGDEQVIFSYIVEDDNKKITDFASFNVLDSSVINNDRHQVIKAAYLFYYATDVGFSTPVDMQALKTRLNALIQDLMILAKRQKCDVFNGLSIMDNALFLEQQKFGKGDGQLHYYLFNYRANPIAGGVDRKNELDSAGLSGIGLPML